MPNFLKKKSLELNAILWKVFNGFENLKFYLPLPKNGRVSFVTSEIKMPDNLLAIYWLSLY